MRKCVLISMDAFYDADLPRLKAHPFMRQLLEHAAGRIVKSLHHRFPKLEAVEITLSKLNPPFGGDLESASVFLRMDYK